MALRNLDDEATYIAADDAAARASRRQARTRGRCAIGRATRARSAWSSARNSRTERGQDPLHRAVSGAGRGSGANRRHGRAMCTVRCVFSRRENRRPDCRRSLALNAQTSQCELTFADAMHQLDACKGDRRIAELLEAEHDFGPGLDISMVLLDQIVQVLRGCSQARGRRPSSRAPRGAKPRSHPA